MDSAPCSPRRPNPTCVFLAHGTVCSSSMCILTGMEESGNEDLKSSMKCAIMVSVDTMCISQALSFLYTYPVHYIGIHQCNFGCKSDGTALVGIDIA